MFCSTSRTVVPAAAIAGSAAYSWRMTIGREAERDLVEQQQPRVGHQRPADGQRLLLAARQDRRRCARRSSASIGNSS